MEIPESAQAKLDRARHHINDLEACIAEYLQQRPMTLVRRFDPSSGYLSLAVKTKIPIPLSIPNIIGDAAHCIRCVLDHLYWDIMESLVSKKQDIQFPIYTAKSKGDVLKRRHVNKAPKNVAQEIEISEPHPGGKFGIYELHALDVQDKHKLLIVAGSAVNIKANLIKVLLPELGDLISGPGELKFTGSGEELFDVALPFNHATARRGFFEDELDTSGAFEIIFRDEPFEGRNVVLQLTELVDNIESRSIAIWAAK